MFTAIEISKISLPVATILGSAYLFGVGNNSGALFILFGGAIFTFLLILIEHAIFVDNHWNDRFRN